MNYLKQIEGRAALGVQGYDELIEYYRDKYESAELVEHLGIPIDDLLILIEDWIDENPNAIEADLEYITKFEEDL